MLPGSGFGFLGQLTMGARVPLALQLLFWEVPLNENYHLYLYFKYTLSDLEIYMTLILNHPGDKQTSCC